MGLFRMKSELRNVSHFWKVVPPALTLGYEAPNIGKNEVNGVNKFHRHKFHKSYLT